MWRNDLPLLSKLTTLILSWALFAADDYDDDDDDGVIDVSVTSRNHGDDDVRDQWRHLARHHHDNDRGLINEAFLSVASPIILNHIAITKGNSCSC